MTWGTSWTSRARASTDYPLDWGVASPDAGLVGEPKFTSLIWLKECSCEV